MWKGLSDYVDEAYRGWMASTMACCGARPSRRDGEGGPPTKEVGAWADDKSLEVCYDQPRPNPPPRREPRHQRSASHSSTLTLTTKLADRSRSLASRASSRGSVLLRGSVVGGRPRRPTIGAPSDFRRVEGDFGQRRAEGFRPLELSIYHPFNRLSPLPDFCSSADEEGPADEDLPPPPLPAFVRTTSVMSLPSSEHRIARKPISTPSSDAAWHPRTHQSFDALSTVSGLGNDWEVQSLRPRPSLPDRLDSVPPRNVVKAPSSARSRWQTPFDLGPAPHRPDADPFRIRESKHARPDSGFLSISSLRTYDTPAFGEHEEDYPRRPSASVLSRPHPLKSFSSHASLQAPAKIRLRDSPARSSAPVRQAGSEGTTTAAEAVSPPQPPSTRWLIPLPRPKEVEQAGGSDGRSPVTPCLASTYRSSPPLAALSPRTRSSTMSTQATRSTFEDPPTPGTITPQTSPGRRPAPFRQRTFGYGDAATVGTAASPIMPTKRLQPDRHHDAVWSVVPDERRLQHHDVAGRRVVSIHDSGSGPASPPSFTTPTTAPVAVGVAF